MIAARQNGWMGVRWRVSGRGRPWPQKVGRSGGVGVWGSASLAFSGCGVVQDRHHRRLRTGGWGTQVW